MVKKEEEKTEKPDTKNKVPQVSGPYLIPEPAHASKKGQKSFHIVGMGASAGGLDAFEQFFTHMPQDNDMAFIVISHLSPGHASVMPELLKKYTRMKVYQIEDQMNIKPNCVYVTPPNKEVGIMNRKLHLLEPAEPHGLRLPIDYFFRSLAHDQGEYAIGIILSGSGSDGTLGIKEIKAELGMVMVQDPEFSRYDGMPKSAIKTGVIDYILPADKMPEQLLRYIHHIPILKPERELERKEITGSLQKILILIRNQTGHDFSFYKKNTIRRRIERRMNVHQVDTTTAYLQFLQKNPNEIKILFQELLIGVTSFFRDREAFEALKEKFFPQLLKERSADAPLRIWVPGCSSGEEVYSLAMILQECMERMKKQFSVQIFGTDIDTRAIEAARAGIYPQSISADVTEERLKRFFIKKEDAYQIKKEIREMAIFAPQNLIKDPPFIKLDILSCRNLLIYLESEVQKKVLPLFHYALRPGGVLFLGTSETVGEFTDLFFLKDKKWRVFIRRESAAAARPIAQMYPVNPFERYAKFPLITEKPPKMEKINLPQLTEKILLESYSPSCAVFNDNGDILYIHGQMGKYLDIAPGEGSIMNILKMAPPGLKVELMGAIRKVIAQKKPIVLENLSIETNGGVQSARVTVKTIHRSEGAGNLMIAICEDMQPQPQPAKGKRKKLQPMADKRHIDEMEKELQYTKEYLQGTIEELETSNEELKSANEELQSTNEELQSTNEELETSQEELQSLNEEHVTLNAELQGRIDELSQSNNDMKNLLESTDIATIFLDNDLRISRFTSPVTEMVNLRATDVGRPISDFVMKLNYEHIAQDAKQVLKDLAPKQVEVQAKDGTWFLMRIRPYRTMENVIDGVVLTFTNIHQLKEAIHESSSAKKYAEAVIDTVREPLVVLDKDLRVVSCNKSFYQTFNVIPTETEKEFIYNLGNKQWNIPKLKELLEEIIPENNVFNDFEVEHEFQKIGKKKMLLNARKIISDEKENEELILLAIEDITDRSRDEKHEKEEDKKRNEPG